MKLKVLCVASWLAPLQGEGAHPDPLQRGTEFMAFFPDPSFPVEHPDENAVRTGFNPAVNQLTWAATQSFDLTAEVGQLGHRVLVLFREDDLAGLPLVEETLAALQSADVVFVLLEKCGHLWRECPGQFYTRVRAFLGLAESQ